MKCFHMTSIDRLKNIEKQGLMPRNENNSKLIQDKQVKVFFSEGYEGAIALWVDFNLVYNKIKEQKSMLDDKELNFLVCNSKNLKEYLGEGVYLSFDKENLINERNFENGCTDEIINPKKLNVVILKDVNSNEITYSRFDIIHYMMSITKIEDIKYYGAKYPNSPSFEEATAKIQNKVKRYYEENKKLIERYKENQYDIVEIILDEFIKIYI